MPVVPGAQSAAGSAVNGAPSCAEALVTPAVTRTVAPSTRAAMRRGVLDIASSIALHRVAAARRSCCWPGCDPARVPTDRPSAGRVASPIAASGSGDDNVVGAWHSASRMTPLSTSDSRRARTAATLVERACRRRCRLGQTQVVTEPKVPSRRDRPCRLDDPRRPSRAPIGGPAPSVRAGRPSATWLVWRASASRPSRGW